MFSLKLKLVHIFFISIEFFIACIILGLEYIHNNNIIHRDLKPENLVCDENGYIRITDFGVAKHLRPNNSSDTSGTPGYMAPEVLCAQNHSYPVDFYAIGIMGYEFMLGDRPYQGSSRKEIKHAVLQKPARVNVDELPRNWSVQSADFINQLIKRKPEKRLGYSEGIKELKEHTWFDGFDWNSLENKTMRSPFIPDSKGNFDKSYCEGVDPLTSETISRYQSYMQEDDYISLFQGYTYIDEEEIKKFYASHLSRNNVDFYSEINNNNSTNENSNIRPKNKMTLNFGTLKKINFDNKEPTKLKLKYNNSNNRNPLLLNINSPTSIEIHKRKKPSSRIKYPIKHLSHYSLLEYTNVNNSSGNIFNHRNLNNGTIGRTLYNSQSMGVLPLNNQNISITNKIENNYIYSKSPILSEKKFFNYNLDKIEEVSKNNNNVYSPKGNNKLEVLSAKGLNCQLPALNSNGNNLYETLNNKLHLKKKNKKMILPISINNSNFNNLKGFKIHLLNKSESSNSMQNSMLIGKYGTNK